MNQKIIQRITNSIAKGLKNKSLKELAQYLLHFSHTSVLKSKNLAEKLKKKIKIERNWVDIFILKPHQSFCHNVKKQFEFFNLR